MEEAIDAECKGVAHDLDDTILAEAPRDLATICTMPIERSVAVELGNGAILMKALDLLKGGDDDWEGKLGVELVEAQLQNSEYSLFYCPECDNIL
jgi:hypothetical protein